MATLKISLALDYVVDARSELLFHVQPAKTPRQGVSDERVFLSGGTMPVEQVDPLDRQPRAARPVRGRRAKDRT